MNTEITINKEIFKDEIFGKFITNAKKNLVSLEKKANDTAKYNAYYIAYFDNNANISAEIVEDWKRHNAKSLKEYVAKELNIGKSQFYNLLAIGKLLEIDEKDVPHYKDKRLENFNATAVGLLINKCPENEDFEDYVNRLFSSGRITEKMSNNEIRTALRDKVVKEDKKEAEKDTKENPIDTLNRIAVDFENFYCEIIGTKFKEEHEIDLNALHRIFEKYVAENPFEHK